MILDRFLDRRDHLRQRFQRARADTIGPARHQEDQHDQRDEPIHERRVADQFPVSGLRSGAPLGSVRNRKTTRRPISPNSASAARATPARKALPWFWMPPSAAARIVGAEPRRDHAVGDECDDNRQEQHRSDGEPEVGRQPDRPVGIDEMSSVIGELDEHGVERLDQHVHRKSAGHRCKAEREAGQRMPPDCQISDAGERYQHEITGISCNTRQGCPRKREYRSAPSSEKR